MIKSIQYMHIYQSKLGHVIIPVKLTNIYWICKVFYYYNNTDILDQGYYAYDLYGRCLEERTQHKNIIKRVLTKSLPRKMQKAIKEWKDLYKKEQTYV